MRSDDELLSHIHQQAGVRRQRRQRALVGAGAAAVVLLLGAGALAAGTGDDGGEVLDADRAGTTTTTTAVDPTTTTADVPTTATDTTTTAPTTTAPTTTVPEEPSTTAPTTVPPSTTAVPAAPTVVSQTDVGEGIAMTVTAAQDPARPGWVDVTVRITADHGSGASGSVTWEEGATPEHFGPWAAHQPTSCDELIDDDPTTDTRPDPGAGPVDDTFTFSHRFDGASRRVTIVVDGYVSFCTTDFVPADVPLPVDIAGWVARARAGTATAAAAEAATGAGTRHTESATEPTAEPHEGEV